MANRTVYVVSGIVAIVIAAGAILFTLVDTDQMEPVPMENKITVYASFFPYYELTREVAADSAVVRQFMPPGVEVHDWDPRAGDLKSLQDADLFVYNGLGIEPYVDSMIDSGEFDHVMFVKAADNVELLKSSETASAVLGRDDHSDEERDDHSDEERDDHGHPALEYDPHVWLDPVLVIQQVNNIQNALVMVDPDNAASYDENAESFIAELNAFDAKVRTELSSCQEDTVVTFHNAFSYLGNRYGLDMLSIGGLAPDSEATASEIAEFVDFVKDNDIKVIFAEELVDTRLAEVIADEAGAQVMVLSPLEALTPEEARMGITLLEKMEKNLDALKMALQCQ